MIDGEGPYYRNNLDKNPTKGPICPLDALVIVILRVVFSIRVIFLRICWACYLFFGICFLFIYRILIFLSRMFLVV